jgi:hypothetical protein
MVNAEWKTEYIYLFIFMLVFCSFISIDFSDIALLGKM